MQHTMISNRLAPVLPMPPSLRDPVSLLHTMDQHEVSAAFTVARFLGHAEGARLLWAMRARQVERDITADSFAPHPPEAA